LIETSLLRSDDEEQYPLMRYSKNFIKMGLGKGIGSYYNRNKFTKEQDIQYEALQVSKFIDREIDVICLYRSQIASSTTLLQELTKLVNVKKPTLIMGDFNTCYRENLNNKLVQGLLNLGFQQLIHEPTHIRGRTIDHAYILNPRQRLRLTVERYSPYYSDHDAICICITNVTEDPEN